MLKGLKLCALAFCAGVLISFIFITYDNLTSHLKLLELRLSLIEEMLSEVEEIECGDGSSHVLQEM